MNKNESNILNKMIYTLQSNPNEEQFDKFMSIKSKFETLSNKIDTSTRLEKIQILREKLNLLNEMKTLSGEELTEEEKEYNKKTIKSLDDLESVLKMLEID